MIDGKDMLPVLFGTGPSAHTALFHYRDDCPGHCANPNATHVSMGAHCVCAGFPLGAPKQKMYAARIRNWKAHFITKSVRTTCVALPQLSPPLGNGV